MVSSFVSLASLVPSKMEWRIKVRVIRLVSNKTDSPHGDVKTIDLILLDSEVFFF
jgi:hypothetical protein